MLRMTRLRRRVLLLAWPEQRGGGGEGREQAINTPFAGFHSLVFAKSVFARILECKMHVL